MSENTNYILSCESTVDMPFSYVSKRDIPVLFYSYTVDSKEYLDDMERDPKALSRFYGFIANGKLPSTSQINTFKYEEYFESLLKQGKDILHIAFGSGMTPSVNNALEAAQALNEKYSGQTITVLDSYCSSSGYGLLVDMAADLRDSGKSLKEVADFVKNIRRKINHEFFTTDLKYFKRSGRVSGPAATLASVLGLCPTMRLNYDGKIVAYGKVRGKKNAIAHVIDVMKQHAKDGENFSGKCFISHADCINDAELLKLEIEKALPKAKGNIRIFNIGTIIASHCGPGTVAAYFVGDERPE